MMLIVALRLFSHGESQSAPESWENFGAICVTKQTTMRRNRRKITRVCEGSESQLRAAAQRCYPNPEDAEDPMIAPPDYDVGQSGRVLELQKQRPLVTINEDFLRPIV